jgi:hypothetical protein
MARQEFQRTFYVFRDLRATDLVLGLPWLDDEQACLQFNTTRVFFIMNRTKVNTQKEERKRECLLMSSRKMRKLVRKTRRSMRRNAEFHVINVTPTAEPPAEFHIEEELTSE